MSLPAVLIDGIGSGHKAAVTADNALLVSIANSTALTGVAFGKVFTSNTSESIVRATTYTEQSTNGQRSIASSSASDTNNGIGAMALLIVYYDSSLAGPFTVTVELNGTTPVPTSADNICFIESMSVIAVGSNVTNVGNISLFVNNDGTGGTIGTIATGDNRTFWAHHYIQGGKTCSIGTFVIGNTGNQNGTAYLKIQNVLFPFYALNQVSESFVVSSGVSSLVRPFVIPLQVSGPARIGLYITPSGNNVNWYGSFDFSEE